MRAVFYYGWFPEHWDEKPHTPPLLGEYSTLDPVVLREHVRQMKRARLEGAIATWWGRGHPTDESYQLCLKETDFLWAPHYELPLVGDGASNRADFDHLYSLAVGYAHKWILAPNTPGGPRKPVIFVYKAVTDNQARTAKLWAGDKWHVVTRGVGGDSRYHYDPQSHFGVVQGQSVSVSPGFWRYDEAEPRLPRASAEGWRLCMGVLKATQDAGWLWQLIISYNEHAEGTAIEPSGGVDYLGIMREAWEPK